MKMIKSRKFIYFFLLSAIPLCLNAENNCESPLIAEYRYTVTDTNKKISQNREVTLWRRENQVVIQTPRSQQAELWELTKNNKIKMTRFFENHQRGIEYQISDIKDQREKNDWSLKYQLISDVLIQKMEHRKFSNDKILTESCDSTQHLSLQDNQKSIDLLWNPKQKLMESLEVREGNITTLWGLTKKISDVDQIDRYYEQLLSYQTTDYADVGDNESDPFLMKMINLGFVEHGASGFYDSAGNNMKNQNERHHGH
ncbi:MAG: hypothetical protein K6L75_13805 [Cellvibrionaceae bacterium]